MVSKLDLLRQGQAIEFEPGLSGKLNQEKKTLELSNGRVLNVANDRDYFPADEAQLKMSKQREYAEKKAKGPVGEFLHQYTSQGVPGGAGDWVSYLTQTGEDYANRKAANQEVSQRISQESPYISGAATGANIATDLALTRGMSALKAAPLLTLGSAGSRIATEPEEVLGETAVSAGLGYGLDKAGGYLNRVAQRRAASRAIPGQQAEVRASNIAGQQATNEANALQTQQFNALKQNVKNVNETRLKQYESDLNTRQNKMIQDQNDFRQAKTIRDSEVVRLKNEAEMAKTQRSANKATADNEYKMAKEAAEREDRAFAEKFKVEQKQYEEDLKRIPEMQRKAQAEYSAGVVKNASEIERSFPKNSKIPTEEFAVSQFIDESINKTGIGGSREAGQSTRILNSLFPEGELIGGRELSKRYKALEDAIQRSSPEVQEVLNNFKRHLGEKLPSILEDTVAFNKITPLIKRTLDSDIRLAIQEIGIAGKGLEAQKRNLINTAISNGKSALRGEVSPSQFVQKIKSGDLSRDIANKILTVEDFLFDIPQANIKSLKSSGMFNVLFEEAQRKHSFFVNELTKKLQSKLSRYEIKAMESARNASKKLGKDVKKTYGLAEPVSPPSPPSPPQPAVYPTPPIEPHPIPPIQLPHDVAPPSIPQMPAKPTLASAPMAPQPQSFIPQAEPTLPPAQGMAERTGDFFEKNLLGGKGIANNPLTKLAGLKYLLGSAALPAEAAYVGMKGLTSPTGFGEAARMTFKQGGIQAIESWARKYPSYHDGILENPQERRSLTKEIEDAYDIPIEQKAVLQSKINRGKPLNQML